MPYKTTGTTKKKIRHIYSWLLLTKSTWLRPNLPPKATLILCSIHPTPLHTQKVQHQYHSATEHIYENKNWHNCWHERQLTEGRSQKHAGWYVPVVTQFVSTTQHETAIHTVLSTVTQFRVSSSGPLTFRILTYSHTGLPPDQRV